MFGYSDFTSDAGVFQSTRPGGLAGPSGGHEFSLEAYYIWWLQPWTYLQPGVMWIQSPGGGDPAPLDDDVLIYLLMGIEL